MAASQQRADFALPYREVDGEARRIDFRTIDAIGPAGAINSSVEQMSRWLLLHLNKGRHGERQIVSEAQLAQMHAPQMVIPNPGTYAEIPYSSYGLGWAVETYRGHPLIQHSGGIDGFTSFTSFLPRDNIGAVVLTNSTTPLSTIVTYDVYDHLLGLDAVPWHERFRAQHDEMKAAAAQGKEKTRAERVPDAPPTHPLAAYAGEYEHPGYGALAVSAADDGLSALFNGIRFPMEHLHYDIFELTLELFEERYSASFGTNVKGDIETVAIPFEPTVLAIVFTRVPAREMTERSFLEQVTGVYALMETTLTVTLKGESALQAAIPGQPEYELVPYRGTEFTLKGLTGFSVEFKRDASGAVAEALVTQPWGVFTAKRGSAQD